jgi:hypothetical protein
MSYIVTDLVKQQTQKLFAPDEAALVISKLETSLLPLIDDGEAPERVHLAILYLSGGDLRRFDRELNGGQIDWRDTLCAAGLGHADWPAVLRSRGIDYRHELMATPQNKFDEAQRILKKYYHELVKQMAEEIIEHREDFESPGYDNRVDSIVEKYFHRLHQLRPVFGNLKPFLSGPKQPNTKLPSKNELHCQACGSAVQQKEKSSKVAGGAENVGNA